MQPSTVNRQTSTVKKALLIGASGLVGGHLLQQLLKNPNYAEVVVLVRRRMDMQHPKLRQEVVDFDHINPEVVKGDDLYCALGTTLRKAGSKAAQYKIDCTYPTEIGRIAKEHGFRQYLLVSSIGADANASGFYLKTKGELENNLQAFGFDTFISARPSFLLGDRKEFRLGEKVGIVLAKLFAPLIPKKYRGIQAAKVAEALIRMAGENQAGVRIVESDKLA